MRKIIFDHFWYPADVWNNFNNNALEKNTIIYLMLAQCIFIKKSILIVLYVTKSYVHIVCKFTMSTTIRTFRVFVLMISTQTCGWRLKSIYFKGRGFSPMEIFQTRGEGGCPQALRYFDVIAAEYTPYSLEGTNRVVRKTIGELLSCLVNSNTDVEWKTTEVLIKLSDFFLPREKCR